MDDRSYLEGTHITRLQSAARMAGLRWKSGDPAYTKAGIIGKLEMHPAICRATISVLRRQDMGGAQPAASGKPNSLLDDMDDELGATPSPAPAPASQSSAQPAQPAADLTPVNRAISALSVRVDAAENNIRALDRRQVTTETACNLLDKNVSSLAKAVAVLQEQRPVQFTINGTDYKPVSGQHSMFPRLVKWLSMRKIDPVTRKGIRTHALLVGPASSGKTTAALEFAKLMGLELYAQALSMDSFAVVGYTSPHGTRIPTEFTKAWINGGVFLWDEMSMSSPEAIGTLNSALANGFISIPGEGTIYAHPDFYFIGGDNSDTGASLKYGARSLLDGASLDRFVRLEWNIDPTIETSLAGTHTQWLACVRAIRAEIDKRDIAHVGATMRAVITGSMALDAGCFTRTEILHDTCKKGLLAEQWQFFEALPAVRAFLQGA